MQQLQIILGPIRKKLINKHRNLLKCRLFDFVEKICDGTVIYESTPDTKKFSVSLLKTQPGYLTNKGKLLRANLVTMKSFNQKMKPSELTCKLSSNSKHIPFAFLPKPR